MKEEKACGKEAQVVGGALCVKFFLYVARFTLIAASANPKSHPYQNGWPILPRKVVIFPEWVPMSKKRRSEMRVGLASGRTTLQ